MYMTFLTLLLLAAVISTIWVYWRVQRIEQHLVQQEASMRDKAREVAELADEILMASEYLYREMDRCLERIEESAPQLQRQVESNEEAEVGVADPHPSAARREQGAVTLAAPSAAEELALEEQDAAEDAPIPAPEPEDQGEVAVSLPNLMEMTPDAGGSVGVSDDDPASEEAPLDAHFQALELAAQGVDALEIARQTGLGTEELRLLLHFREAINMTN